MKKNFFIFILSLLLLSVSSAYGCFDTYLFVNKYSMVYPYNEFVIEGLGEYSLNKISNPDEDTFFANFNAYYGIAKRFSLQAGIFSSENERPLFKVNEFGVKGVYNVLTKNSGYKYTLDVIVFYKDAFAGERTSDIEISLPNIFYIGNNTLVIHPVFEQTIYPSFEYVFGGHIGIFHTINGNSLVGIGAEYDSPQSGSLWDKRLIDGEAGVSLFLGTSIGKVLYIQSEFAKGIANSRDFGYAFTVKLRAN